MCNQLQGLCYKKGFFHGMICIATTALEHTNARDLHCDQVFATLCSGRWSLVIVI